MTEEGTNKEGQKSERSGKESITNRKKRSVEIEKWIKKLKKMIPKTFNYENSLQMSKSVENRKS